jgi:hypothetical protein
LDCAEFWVAPLGDISYGSGTKKGNTYQPATLATVLAAGSEPLAARVAYLIVELVAMGVRSFKIATSLSKSSESKSGWMLREATGEVTPPEPRF